MIMVAFTFGWERMASSEHDSQIIEKIKPRFYYGGVKSLTEKEVDGRFVNKKKIKISKCQSAIYKQMSNDKPS